MTRGVRAEQELRSSAVYRDVRPFGQRFAIAARDPQLAFMIFGITGTILLIGPFLIPQLALFTEPALIVCGIYFYFLRAEVVRAPLRKPKHSGELDPGDRHPKTKRPKIAQGIGFYGNLKDTFEEVWLCADFMTRHGLMLGTTGGGKSVALLGMLADALCRESGGVYIDGKGDTELHKTVSSYARRMGRDDDLRVLNFLTDGSDALNSHSLNPLATSSAPNSVNLVVSLMGASSGDDMWRGRAIALIESVFPVLVHLRDKEGELLNFATLREAITLKNIIRRSRAESIPEELRFGLQSYLDELPGYNDDYFSDDGVPDLINPDKAKAINEITQQHGFLQMQFTRILQNLSKTYGPIFRTIISTVDMSDIVLNRRILVVMLPALMTSSDELANLGRIVSAIIKDMMGRSLGAKLEGATADIIDSKPTNSDSPMLVIYDELGYYISDGMDVQLAQARSLGFNIWIGSQEVNSLRKKDPAVANAMMGNTALKIFMKLADADETREFLMNAAGSASVSVTSGYSMTSTGTLTPTYQDRMDAALERRDRVDWLDIVEQAPGEAHVLFESKLLRMNMIYATPEPLEYLRLNRFLEVKPPDPQQLLQLKKAPPPKKSPGPTAANTAQWALMTERSRFRDRMEAPDFDISKPAPVWSEGFQTCLTTLVSQIEDGASPEAAAVAAISSYLDSDTAKLDAVARLYRPTQAIVAPEPAPTPEIKSDDDFALGSTDQPEVMPEMPSDAADEGLFRPTSVEEMSERDGDWNDLRPIPPSDSPSNASDDVQTADVASTAAEFVTSLGLSSQDQEPEASPASPAAPIEQDLPTDARLARSMLDALALTPLEDCIEGKSAPVLSRDMLNRLARIEAAATGEASESAAARVRRFEADLERTMTYPSPLAVPARSADSVADLIRPIYLGVQVKPPKTSGGRKLKRPPAED